MKLRRLFESLLLAILLSILYVGSASAGCYDKRSPGMDWSGCDKMNKMLDEVNFSGSIFDNAKLQMSKFDNSDFTGASLVKADFSRSSFIQANFTRSDLTKAIGYRANFKSALFSETRMSKSEFSRASFEDAKLTDIDWSRAELGRVNFHNALLKAVNFEFTNLSRVNFNRTKLVGVNFAGAYTFLTRFENVDLRMTSQISQGQLDIACGNDETLLPTGLKRPANWDCED